MSEESDNQQPLETQQAPTRRRRPSRRGGRGRSGTGRSSREVRNESPTSEGNGENVGVDRNESGTDAPREAAERMTSDSNVGDAQHEDGGSSAMELGAGKMTENMSLGNPETSSELSADDATQT